MGDYCESCKQCATDAEIDALREKLAQAELDLEGYKAGEGAQKAYADDLYERLRASEASAAAMTTALKRWRDTFDQVAKDPNLVIYGPMFYQAKAIADRALASDAGAKVLAVVEAAREYTKERQYQNFQACREDQERLEKILLDALKSLDSSSGEPS